MRNWCVSAVRGASLLGVGVVSALIIAACGGSAASTGSLSGRSGAAAGRGGQRAAVAVERTATVEHIAVHRQVDLSGTLMSPEQARVSSEVAGPVREVLVQLGSIVRPGDVLIRLDPRELQLAADRSESALNQALAQLGIPRGQNVEPPGDEQVATVRQASANLEDARAAYARADQLGGRGLLSRVDKDTAETRLKVSEANYTAALDAVRALKASLQDRRAAFELAQKKLNDAAIRAPVGGSISERLVQPGEFIKENTPVVTIVQMSPLKLRTAVQEKFASVIKAGQTVDFVVEAFPGQTFTGKIAYISPAVDQTTRTFAVEAMVVNEDGRLKPGFFANGAVGTRVDENVPALTEDAISTLAGVSSVFVVEDGKIRQQAVTLGARQGKLVEITTGLKGTETLAASNLGQLATGTQVQIGKAAGRGARGEGAQ
jgi:RND family efflux transporter MFP subunit